jgi:hypothetical protein
VRPGFGSYRWDGDGMGVGMGGFNETGFLLESADEPVGNRILS